MRTWSEQELRQAGYDPLTGARAMPMAAAAPRLSAAAIAKLKPEQRLQIAVIERLRPRLVEGARLHAFGGELPGGSKLFRLWQFVRRLMGYEAGAPDLQCLHAGRAYFIELKRPRGDADLLGHKTARGELSTVQRGWRQWAQAHGFPWCTARSVAEVEVFLRACRLLTDD